MKKLYYVVIGLFAFAFIAYLFIKKEPLPTYNVDRYYIEGKENEILAKFLLAKDSSVIELDEGHFLLGQSLILDGVNNVTIRGKGIHKTVLSFKGQNKGAEGIRISNAQNITLENLTVEDAKGDNIKVMDTKGIIIRNVQSSWVGKVSEKNGAYAFYPVLCENVTIDGCISIGASDAGIYVGQSQEVTISNNTVFYNVAGIESENSTNVKIFGNEVYENTGGILVFDLPGLTRYGKNIEVFNNKIYNNNIKNYAPEGSIVGQTPSGTGALVLATENVHFHDNVFTNNKTTSIALSSYLLIYEMGKRDAEEEKSPDELGNGVASADKLNDEFLKDKKYNPYNRKIKIGVNSYSNSRWFPTLNNDFGKLLLFKKPFQTIDILWDGVVSPNTDYTICIDNTKDINFYNADLLNDFKNATTNESLYKCR
ncbi:parallel beta-helix domain-containing protein [Tenacibaculum xiamenense]|uniref:parallel beta-helix domain-containing protein n=1 Tax=Tenacibaculum xiamenense TaxID=1261553 RepID=UPI003892DA0E